MRLEGLSVSAERHLEGGGPEGLFFQGDSIRMLEGLLADYEGRIKLIYMDPPYLTGDRFYMRVRVGEAQWKSGRGGLALGTFVDQKDRTQFLALMRRVLELCKRLLCDAGMIFVHVDYRADAHIRLLMDEIFGEDNFLNEIIWCYQSGGRSVRHFSRKHDVIFFYAKSANYDFNIEAVMAPPASPRTNHMRRHVDPDGRVYRSIRVGGKVYTYYDDDPVAPTDVWSDVGFLQQKDPERTGYDTQKPLALLGRIVSCASRPGDWVLDPFAGSGTTLEAARRGDRRFIGIDQCPMTLNIARRRLKGARYSLFPLAGEGDTPQCQAQVQVGVGFYHVYLDGFDGARDLLGDAAAPLDAVDNWSVGYLREDGYHVMAEFARTRQTPALETMLRVPAYSGRLALCVGDIRGRSWYYGLEAGIEGEGGAAAQ